LSGGLSARIKGIDLHVPAEMATPALARKLDDGSYEADEARAASLCVREGFRVLELGAGLGFVTAVCAQGTAPENILAIEANPALIPVIEDTLARNGAQGATVLHGAVVPRADEGATAPFHVADEMQASRLGAKARKERRCALGRLSRPDPCASTACRPDRYRRSGGGPVRSAVALPACGICVMELHPRRYPPRVIKKIVDAMSRRWTMTYDPGHLRVFSTHQAGRRGDVGDHEVAVDGRLGALGQGDRLIVMVSPTFRPSRSMVM
jgi:hypothetical protein